LAQQRLIDVFGMELVEVDAKTKGTYILTSPFSPIQLDEFINTKSVSQETESIVLMATLSLIEISNGRIDIDKALEALGNMGLEKLEYKDKRHEKYWENLVRHHFQKQLYIKSTKESGQGRDITYISSGFRTSIEIGRININKHIAKLNGDEMDEIRLKEIENEEADREKEEELARTQQQTQHTQSRGRQATQSQTPTQTQKRKQTQDQSQSQSQTSNQKRKQSQVQSQVASQSQSSQSQTQSQSQSNRGSATKKARRG